MACYGKGTVAAAAPELIPFMKTFLEKNNGYRSFIRTAAFIMRSITAPIRAAKMYLLRPDMLTANLPVLPEQAMMPNACFRAVHGQTYRRRIPQKRQASVRHGLNSAHGLPFNSCSASSHHAAYASYILIPHDMHFSFCTEYGDADYNDIHAQT